MAGTAQDASGRSRSAPWVAAVPRDGGGAWGDGIAMAVAAAFKAHVPDAASRTWDEIASELDGLVALLLERGRPTEEALCVWRLADDLRTWDGVHAESASIAFRRACGSLAPQAARAYVEALPPSLRLVALVAGETLAAA